MSLCALSKSVANGGDVCDGCSTENALLRLPFKAAYMFRPGFIEPKAGIRSKTAFYRLFYRLTRPVMPLLRRAFPNSILTTEQLGRAMIAVAQGADSKRILESRDILALSRITFEVFIPER